MHTPVEKLLNEKNRSVETVSPGGRVAEAVRKMNERRIGSVLVVANGKPVGIFTERDVLVRVLAARLDPDRTVVGHVMTRDPVYVSPRTTLQDALLLMSHHHCRHLPVIEDGELVAMVSIGDLTAWLVRSQQHRIDDLHRYISGGYPAADQAVP